MWETGRQIIETVQWHPPTSLSLDWSGALWLEGSEGHQPITTWQVRQVPDGGGDECDFRKWLVCMKSHTTCSVNLDNTSGEHFNDCTDGSDQISCYFAQNELLELRTITIIISGQWGRLLCCSLCCSALPFSQLSVNVKMVSVYIFNCSRCVIFLQLFKYVRTTLS